MPDDAAQVSGEREETSSGIHYHGVVLHGTDSTAGYPLDGDICVVGTLIAEI